MELLLQFLATHNTVSPRTLDEVLESLEDMGMLNQKGAEFKTLMRETFIHKNVDDAGEEID